MKTFYQVRIDDELRAQFIDACPWGYQGPVLETLIQILIARIHLDGPQMTIAKLLEGHYILSERNEDASS